MKQSHKISCLLMAFLALAATPAMAYVMSSSNYRIERDSINMNGGLGTSTSYALESTMGEAASGLSTTTSYQLLGGYQQMATTSLSISIPGTTVLVSSISLAAGGTATASAAVDVTTNNSLGYTLQIKASTSPALKFGANSFADYTLAGSNPDYDWSVASAASEFGFTPQGVDILTRYKDNGSSCNQALGSDTSNHCWDPFAIIYGTIAQSSASNYPTSTQTNLVFKAEAGLTAAQPIGTYTATIIIMAYAN